MKRLLVLGLTAALSFGTWTQIRAEGLQFVEVNPTHGIFGPVREGDVFHPLDVLDFRYRTTGLKLDAEGKCDLVLTLRITDSDDAVIKTFERSIKQVFGLGGDEFSGHASYFAPKDLDEGEYTFTISLKDQLGDSEATHKQKMICKATGFRIALFRTFRDPERRVPAGTRWLVNERLHFALMVVGEDRSQGKVDLKLRIQVLDENGKPLIPEPISTELTEDREKILKEATSITMAGAIGLHRTGKFRVQVTVEDVPGKQSATVEYPIQVDLP